jgi:hypothetical protein
MECRGPCPSVYPQHFLLLDTDCNLSVQPGFSPCDPAHAGNSLWSIRPLNLTGNCHPFLPHTQPDEVCASDFKDAFSFFNDSDHVTVVISTFSEQRAGMLEKSINHYAASALTSAVVVVWNNNKFPAPHTMVAAGKLVYFSSPATNSLINRFRPILQMSTACVLTIDDDIFLHLDDLEGMFRTWRSFPERITGFFPRWFLAARDGGLSYLTQSEDPNNMMGGYPLMLTKAMMTHKKYLWEFSCGVGRLSHALVEHFFNCEDLAINFMIANMTRGPSSVLAVPEHLVADCGQNRGLHTRGLAHENARSACLQRLEVMYGRPALATEQVNILRQSTAMQAYSGIREQRPPWLPYTRSVTWSLHA